MDGDIRCEIKSGARQIVVTAAFLSIPLFCFIGLLNTPDQMPSAANGVAIGLSSLAPVLVVVACVNVRIRLYEDGSLVVRDWLRREKRYSLDDVASLQDGNWQFTLAYEISKDMKRHPPAMIRLTDGRKVTLSMYDGQSVKLWGIIHDYLEMRERGLLPSDLSADDS